MLPTRTLFGPGRKTVAKTLFARPASSRLSSVYSIHTSTTARKGQAVPLLINGKENRSGPAFDVKHPRTGEVVTKVHGASKEDL